MTFCSTTPGFEYCVNTPSRRGKTLLRTRRIICLTCVQPHIPKSMGKLKDGHRIFNLTRQMKGKPCSCHISLTGTLTVSYCLVSYTKDQAWLSNFRMHTLQIFKLWVFWEGHKIWKKSSTWHYSVVWCQIYVLERCFQTVVAFSEYLNFIRCFLHNF